MPRTSSRLEGKVKDVPESSNTRAPEEEEELEQAPSSDGEFEVQEEGPTEKLGKRKRRQNAKRVTTKPKGKALSSKSTSKATTSAGADARLAKRVRGMRGALQNLPEMPLDVIYEILARLGPLDILNLARTSKELRGFLMHRSATNIWKASVANSEPELPPCPPDLSDPAWVDLALGRQCQFCLRNVADQTIVWKARVRGCNPCLQKQFTVRPRWSGGLTLYVGSCDMGPYIPNYTVTVGKFKDKGVFYHTPTVKMLKEYSFKTSEEREAWSKAKIKELEEQAKMVPKYEEWDRNRKQRQQEAMLAERQSRKDGILLRLGELGLASSKIEVLRGSERFWKDSVLNPLILKAFTSRIWANAKAQVLISAEYYYRSLVEEQNIDAMTSRHTLILELRKSYLKTRPINDFVPPAADIFASPEVQALFSGTPPSQQMQISDLDVIASKMTEISERWVGETKKKLLELCGETLKTSEGDESANKAKFPILATHVSFLDLAVVVFKCEDCQRYFDYAQTLLHSCAKAGSVKAYTNKRNYDVESFVRRTKEFPWNAQGSIVFDVLRAREAVKLLKKLTYNPETTTFKELDDADDIFECRTCSGYGRGRLMLTWRNAVGDAYHSEHDIVKILDAESLSFIWKKMWEEAVRNTNHRPIDRFKLAEFESDPDSVPSDIKVTIRRAIAKDVVCAHCRDELRASEVREHLLKEHNITDAESEDAVDLLDRNPRQSYRYYQYGRVNHF